MNENENVGFDDFENALFGDDYQFDDDSDSEEVETDDTEEEETEESEEGGEAEGEEDEPADEAEEESDAEDSEEEEAEGEEPTGDTDAGQTFTIKVNKEERQVSLEEMTTLAQKGADYDRVKEQNAKSQQTIQDLQAQLEGYTGRKNVLEILDIVAEKTGTKLEDLAEMLYISTRKSAGASEEVAKEELKSAKLEKELNGIKAQQTKSQQTKDDAQERAQRDLEEFQRNYPDVELTDALVEKLTADIAKGMSLSAAYRKMEKAQDAARIQELERQLAAKAQNDKNKKRSPGSQKDSGGRRTRSDYDEFERALFG